MNEPAALLDAGLEQDESLAVGGLASLPLPDN